MTSLDKFSREYQVRACCHQTRRGWPICSRSIRGIKKTDPFAGLWQQMRSRVHAVDGPYDEFCPSLQKDLSNRVCKRCHSCFTSATAVSRHRKGCLSLKVVCPCLGYQSPKIRCLSTRRRMSMMIRLCPVMPGITVEDILNSPFIEIDVEEEGDEDEQPLNTPRIFGCFVHSLF